MNAASVIRVTDLQRGDEDNQFYYRGVCNTADTSTIGLWASNLSLDPPEWGLLYEYKVIVREPFDDGWGQYDEYSTPSYIA
jgi:hypothetical protein